MVGTKTPEKNASYLRKVYTVFRSYPRLQSVPMICHKLGPSSCVQYLRVDYTYTTQILQMLKQV